MSERTVLHKVSELEILGKKFDLARNGTFALVEPKEEDAYGRPVSRVVVLADFVTVDSFQAVLNLLGDAIVRQQSTSDLRRAQIGEEKGEGV